MKLLLLIFFLTTFLFSQDEPPEVLYLEDLLKSFNYKEIVTVSDSLLRHNIYNDSSLIKILLFKGISHYTLKQDNLAAQSFNEILELESSYQPDSDYTPPKIITFYDSLRQRFLAAQQKENENIEPLVLPEEQVVQSISLKSHNMKILHSLIIPGIGHFESGSPVKGYIFTSLGLITMGSFILFSYDASKKGREYYNNTIERESSAKFNSYDFSSKMRDISLISFGIVWLLTQVDFLLFDENNSQIQVVANKNLYGLRLSF